MIRLIDLVDDKKRTKPIKKDQKNKEEKQKVGEESATPESDALVIFKRPQKRETEKVGKKKVSSSESYKRESSRTARHEPVEKAYEEPTAIFARSKRESAVLPKEQATEKSTLDEAIDLYDIGIRLLHELSTMKTIDDAAWQEILDFIGKVVGVATKDPKVSTDVATNYFKNFSFRYATIMNTCLLAIHTGIGLRFTKRELVELGTAAFLHDVGMFDLPEEILNKKGKLDSKEWETLKKHPIYSLQKLEKLSEVSENIKMGISQAHERVDGNGYPDGLKKGEIHKYAQVINIVNAYEAMTHPRTHQEKRLPYAAMKEIISLAGKVFDPKIARMFVNQVSVYPVGSLVWLNNGETAKVVDANKNFPLRPVVAVLLDNNGFRLGEPRIVNLRDNMILHIKKSADPEAVVIDANEILSIVY